MWIAGASATDGKQPYAAAMGMRTTGPTADIMLNAQRTLNPMEAAIPPRIASVDEQMGDFAAFPPLPGCSDTQSFFLSDFKT